MEHKPFSIMIFNFRMATQRSSFHFWKKIESLNVVCCLSDRLEIGIEKSFFSQHHLAPLHLATVTSLFLKGSDHAVILSLADLSQPTPTYLPSNIPLPTPTQLPPWPPGFLPAYLPTYLPTFLVNPSPEAFLVDLWA